MAQPQMVDIRQLNPQQLTEVSQRIDQELQVLQGRDMGNNSFSKNPL